MKKLLIVDDEPDLVEILSRLLGDDQVQLLTAHDGEQGLVLAREQLPDLVLSDIEMPRLDGRELCRRLKADRITQGIPVILMGATEGPKAWECSADCFIPKPFRIASVVEAVHRLLAGSV